MSSRTVDTQVIIVGAGPVGLTLALDLGNRGIHCALIEQKQEPQFLPKMERCNARTMEMYRRIGLADAIRAAGLPTDSPMDVYVVLSLTRPPLLHLKYPSVGQARHEIEASRDGTRPLEPYQLISQYTLEPLLKAQGRHPFRPEHIHFLIEAPGYRRLVTHLFAAGDEYLDSDVVFGVKNSLVREYVRHSGGTAPDGQAMQGEWYSLHHDFSIAADRL